MFDRATAAIAIFLSYVGPAQAGLQLFHGSWVVKAFGNERTGGTGESEFYSAIGIPGVACDALRPLCPWMSTPTDGAGNFSRVGGPSGPWVPLCAPWYDFAGMGTAVRPAKGLTQTTGGKHKRPIPPLYRNWRFFSAEGLPSGIVCTPASTGATPGGKGLAQAGHPIDGIATVSNTASTTHGGLVVDAAEPGYGFGSGIQAVSLAGARSRDSGYGYTYSYAALRNDAGLLAAGNGPGSFNLQSFKGKNRVASIRVKQGAAKFGGTMRMLGSLTTKVASFRNGGFSLGGANWYFDLIGAAAYTSLGVVTKGYQRIGKAFYFNSALGQSSTVIVEASRFPWTTGSVTVTASGIGHRTVHYGHGYDNRGPVRHQYPLDEQSGTLQLVSPVLTRWLRPGSSHRTAGIAILRFVPEPRAWVMLAAGLSALAFAYRLHR